MAQPRGPRSRSFPFFPLLTWLAADLAVAGTILLGLRDTLTHDFYGNFGMAVRALAYIQANGFEGLRQTTQDAVLNANYMMRQIKDRFELPHDRPCMHECVFSDQRQAAHGVRTGDIAKRLIDYGFQHYTTSFPLIVPGALMIEPTESASKEEMDSFIEALGSIAREAEEDPQLVLKAPHGTRVSRLDEAAAARHPILRWEP